TGRARIHFQYLTHRQYTLRYIRQKYTDNQLLNHCSARAADPGEGVFHTPAAKCPKHRKPAARPTAHLPSEIALTATRFDRGSPGRGSACEACPVPHAPPFVSPQSPPASTNARYPR